MKKILITGASSGFGKLMAELLHSQGYKVVGTSRQPEKYTTNFPLIKLDVSKEDSVINATNEYFTKYGELDILINNAGFGISGPVEDFTLDEAKAQFDTNFFGTFCMIKYVLPHMRSRKKGTILNISSIAGFIGLPFQAFYSASKFAMEGLVEGLRLEVEPFNIKVFNINPGDYKTDFTENRIECNKISLDYKDRYEKTLSKYKKDELGGSNPSEVASLVLKLINKEKNYKVGYLVGRPDQKLSPKLKGILNSRFFEKLIKNHYNL